MIRHTMLKLAAALALLTAGGTVASAQDAGALVEALVRKGILTDQEAEAVRADMTRDFSTTPAGKLNLSNSISELKLYGDLRLRYQYENKDLQANPAGVGVNNRDEDRSPSGNQRSRWRFRLRLNADFKLAENFFGGVELSTQQTSDSGNQTFQDGFSDYNIFISRAWLGWSPSDWLTVTAGKVPNPFYTTELVYDPDINPTGVTQSIAFHRFHFGGGNGAAAGGGGYSKDGTSYAPAPEVRGETPWELTLNAGQFIFDDNDENAFDNDASTDSYLFHTQLVASYKFGATTKLTVAPGWMIYNASQVAATFDINENDFQDDDGLAGLSGGQRNLNILLLPGDLSFNLGTLKTKLYWDFAYNLEARKRVEEIYQNIENINLGDDPDDRQAHSKQDDIAYLIGLQLGENKKKGDWSILTSYRHVGLGAIDPNLNDSDFASSELNVRGVKFGLAYNFTDFCIGAVTYMHAWNIRRDLFGGEATGGNAIADANEVQVLQVDLNLKF